MDAPRGKRSVRHGRMWPHTDGGAAAVRRHALRARAISRTDVQKGGPRVGGGAPAPSKRRPIQDARSQSAVVPSVAHHGPLPTDNGAYK